VKPVKINRIKEWKVEKILNKKKDKKSCEVLGTLKRIYSRK